MRILWVYRGGSLFHALYEPTPEKREHCAATDLQKFVKEIKRTIGPIVKQIGPFEKQNDIIVVRFSPPGDAVISDRKIRIDSLDFVPLKEEEIKQLIDLFNNTN